MMDAGIAMPMAAAPESAMEFSADEADSARQSVASKSTSGASTPEVEPTVRTKFADTAFWVGVARDRQRRHGRGQRLDMPENLTTWRIRVWGMGHGTKVGEGAADVVTRKNLIVRLQAPRFFVETDEVVLSANVHNYLREREESPRPCWSWTATYLKPTATNWKAWSRSSRTARPASTGGVKVAERGKAVVRMKALTDEESDAMEMSFPGLRPRDAQDGHRAQRRDRGRTTERQVRPSRCPPSGGPSRRGSRSATRRRWPGRWSTPCPTWSTIPTAAPSRRSTASCRR